MKIQRDQALQITFSKSGEYWLQTLEFFQGSEVNNLIYLKFWDLGIINIDQIQISSYMYKISPS